MGGAGITEFIPTGRKWLSSDDSAVEKLRVREGWILITRSGSTGIVSTVPAVWDGVAVSEHVIRIIPDPTKAPAGYLYAVLSSQYGQEYLRRGVFGSVIDEITPEYIADMPIPLTHDGAITNSISESMGKAEMMRTAAMQTFNDSIKKVEALLNNG
jgi:type I restriction enzyme M protein